MPEIKKIYMWMFYVLVYTYVLINNTLFQFCLTEQILISLLK